jgi:hypothetical protein
MSRSQPRQPTNGISSRILLSDLECLAASSFVETPRMDNPPAENLVRLHSQASCAAMGSASS